MWTEKDVTRYEGKEFYPFIRPEGLAWLAKGETCGQPPKELIDEWQDIRLKANQDVVQNNQKLSSLQVKQIVKRGQSGETITQLANCFGISHGHVADILSGRIWSHLTGLKK